MNCPDFDTLMMMIDGELREEQLKTVSEHLMSCSKCRKLVDSQIMLEKTWRDNFVLPDNEKFRSMERSIYKKINSRWRWKALIPAAAGIIAVLLGFKLILSNRPSLDRITDLSGTELMEYVADNEKSGQEQIEFLSSVDDELHNETAAESAPHTESPVNPVAAENTVEEMSPGLEADGVTEGDLAQAQSTYEEGNIEESLRGTVGFAQETDEQIISGGAVAGSGAGGGDFYRDREETEESETASEITFMAMEEISVPEEQAETVGDITLSLDSDTAGLETVVTVSTPVSASEEMQDNRESSQSAESYSRYHEYSDVGFGMTDEEVYVELVFDANGIPDSSTVLILDSLLAGWNEYIPFYCRDTILVVPLADVQELFVHENNVHTETNE